MPNEEVNQAQSEEGNPDLNKQMLAHESEPAASEHAQAVSDGLTDEQIGELVTDSVVEDPTQLTPEEELKSPDRIKDPAKAQVMAEAGADFRDMARAHSESDLPESLRMKYRTRRNNHSFGYEGKGMTFKQMLDHDAEWAEEQTGKAYEAAKTSDYSHDTEKAMHMTRAEGNRKTNLAEATPKEAGDKYDLETAEAQLGQSRVEALKNASEDRVVGIFLRYSRKIVENYRKHGDELTPNLRALEIIAKSFPRHKGLAQYDFGKWVRVELNDEKDGAIEVSTSGNYQDGTGERWHIPMFDEDPEGYRGRGRSRDHATYEVTEATQDPDGKFDRVLTKKTRQLGDEDIANLEKLFGRVSSFRAAQEANTIHPGDDEYEDTMRDIYDGVDGSNGGTYLEERFGIKA